MNLGHALAEVKKPKFVLFPYYRGTELPDWLEMSEEY